MATTESIRDDMAAYGKRLQEARDQGKYWKQEEDLARTRLLALMEPNSIQEFPDIVITSFVHEQRKVSLQRLRDEYPDVAEICTEIHTHTRIETHRRGGHGQRARKSSRPQGVPTPEKLDSPGYVESLIQQHLPPTEEMVSGD
jgi:hypothetical protein